MRRTENDRSGTTHSSVVRRAAQSCPHRQLACARIRPHPRWHAARESLGDIPTGPLVRRSRRVARCQLSGPPCRFDRPTRPLCVCVVCESWCRWQRAVSSSWLTALAEASRPEGIGRPVFFSPLLHIHMPHGGCTHGATITAASTQRTGTHTFNQYLNTAPTAARHTDADRPPLPFASRHHRHRTSRCRFLRPPPWRPSRPSRWRPLSHRSLDRSTR